MSILKIVIRFLSLLLSLYDVYRHSFSTTLLAKVQKNGILIHNAFFGGGLGALKLFRRKTEEEAVRQYDRRAAILFQPVHDDGHEQIRRLAAGEVIREVVLHVLLLAAAVGRVHQDHVELILLRVIQHIVQQAVVVEHLRHIEAVQQQIGDAEHVGELLLLNAVDGIPVFLRIRRVLDLLLQLAKPAGDEAARAAGKVRHLLADPRLDHPRHEVGHGAGRVELARGTGALQLLENGFVDLVKGVALLVAGKIQLVDLVDDLPEKHAVLHVLIGVGERCLDDRLPDGRGGVYGELFQRREKRIVYEIQQSVARQRRAGSVVVRPVHPAARSGNDGLIRRIVKFPVLLLGVVDLQKQHPRDLLNALGIAVDACVVPHDIAYALYKSGQIAH